MNISSDGPRYTNIKPDSPVNIIIPTKKYQNGTGLANTGYPVQSTCKIRTKTNEFNPQRKV